MTIVSKPSQPVRRDARAGAEFGGPWYVTLLLVAVLHWTGLFHLSEL